MTLARRCLAEGVGTGILVALGCGAIMVEEQTHAFGHSGIASAFGLAVALVVGATGHVGGAHINPAVTIGLWSAGRHPGREVAPYVAAQLTGAVVASAALVWLLGPVASAGATLPSVGLAQAAAIEGGFTAVLGLVIMGVALDPRGPASLAPILLGATVCLGALVTGPLTGGSFNPARSFGPALVTGTWRAHWLYWVAPVLGMIVGLKAYDACFAARSGLSSDAPTATRPAAP